MDDIDEVYEKLDANVPAGEIREEIAGLIENYLQKAQELGYWEKLYFLNAISALAWNRSQEPTSIWLRLSLFSIVKALVPKSERNENFGNKDAKIEALTHQDLIKALRDAL